ncbi:T9SS type A sorting domain-containing protein [Siansivirga zeaxanthinifaciens]|uniref:Secretion system C-terminal sorting domain-containing protein n=1 Tax=Siansivirga zeaxanthinifaciens CC-SAMT-1 TaxID=1454006 RepID=A0A0C5W0X9_9FLAO|nr:T9SS type A sorting domain-containing protein [Siansivirga zeaxanthinifaciens]AJR04996.1 hypothetical protein AW14_13750 [Siansivirga zeaxanthinifaciens CC-SAMT-1]
MKKNYLKTVLATVTLICTLNFNAQIIADGTYNIYNTNLSEVLSVNRIPMGDAGNPQNVIIGRARMQTYNINNDDQQWTFAHQGNDVYKITNVGDNSILGVKDGWCGQFGDVQVGFDNSSPYTLFKVVAGTTANTYVFQIAFDSDCNFGSVNIPIKAFDIDGGNSGSKINTFDINTANPNQQFQILALGTLSTESNFLSNKITLYYNQVEGLVVDTNTSRLGDLKVNVFDLMGRSIASEKINNNHSSIKLDNTKTGVYIALIKDSENNTLVKKFVVY